MKQILTPILLAFLLLLGNHVLAQKDAKQNWRWQNPFPTGNHLRGSASPDSNTIIMVGDVGTILKSKDNGQSWTRLKTNLREDLRSVIFLDEQTGYACGSNGTIIKTTNCGETWENILSRGDDTLRSIGAIGDIIIAVGDSGSIFRSPDGGNTWEDNSISGFDNGFVRFRSAFSGNGYVIMDSLNPIFSTPYLVTTDSGLTFSEWGTGFPTNLNAGFNDFWLDKTDPNKAVLVGDRGTIVYTFDGGSNWTAPLVAFNQPLTGVWFFNGTSGFATGPRDELLKTNDCGKTWQVLVPGFQRNLLTIVGNKDSSVFFGGVFGGLFATPDGGNTFTKIQTGFFPELTSVTFLDDSFGIAAGQLGSALRTEDGGNTWLEGFAGPFQRWEGATNVCVGDTFAFNIRKDIFLAGGDFGQPGRITVSRDSGKTWTPQLTSAANKFFSITFADSLNGTAVGLDGTIYCTQDGGKSWKPKNSGTTNWLLDVDMPNDSTAYAVGGFGTIIRSTDFGTNWQALNSRTQEWLTAVNFLDDSIGMAAGNHGVILRTTDGGANWDDVSPPNITFDFTDLSIFLGPKVSNKTEGLANTSVAAVAVGYGGTILYSPDFGDTWIEQDSRTDYPLNACHFTDSINGHAVGFFGTILRTDSREIRVGIENQPHNWKMDSPLGFNYPNPVIDHTLIPFEVEIPAPVDLRIFDLKGQEVDRLIYETMAPAKYEVSWEPKQLAPGTYVYRLQVGHRSYSRKLIIER